MGNFRPFPLKCWESFLMFNGYIKARTTASHDQWTKKNARTIPVWGNEKQIPAQHLKTSCFSMGISLLDLYKWADANC